jgi:dethiobiotin synthetase
MKYFVTAINTDSGKTLVSAILCQALGADYWKPVQAGRPADADVIRALVQHGGTTVHKERWFLNTPASPHAAAKVDKVSIHLDDFLLPETNNSLIIEGAGGCLVPLNDRDFVIDIAMKFTLPVIVVSNLYLGSINHTLLTFEALKRRGLHIEGIIFNGTPNQESERIILSHTKAKCLLKIMPEEVIDRETVLRYASKLNETWK